MKNFFNRRDAQAQRKLETELTKFSEFNSEVFNLVNSLNSVFNSASLRLCGSLNLK
jgi:hypothetical protein